MFTVVIFHHMQTFSHFTQQWVFFQIIVVILSNWYSYITSHNCAMYWNIAISVILVVLHSSLLKYKHLSMYPLINTYIQHTYTFFSTNTISTMQLPNDDGEGTSTQEKIKSTDHRLPVGLGKAAHSWVSTLSVIQNFVRRDQQQQTTGLWAERNWERETERQERRREGEKLQLLDKCSADYRG